MKDGVNNEVFAVAGSPNKKNVVRSLAIGAVSYLNSRPLTDSLERLAPDARVVFDLPSRLADELSAGRLDVALVPSIEYFRHPGWTIVSDACVSCEGPVRSVKLFGRVPVEQIATLALDEGSRASAALARIVLGERYGVEPRAGFVADRQFAFGYRRRRNLVDWRSRDADQ